MRLFFASNNIDYFLLGAHKNGLDEMVLFSTNNNVWVGWDKNFYILINDKSIFCFDANHYFLMINAGE